MADTTWQDPDIGKSPEQLFAERTQRFEDAIHLRKPDRIPILLDFSFMLAEMGGITKQELMENPVKAQQILEESALKFQGDAVMGVFGSPESGLALGDQTIRWPGHGIGPNDAFQFVEGEYMKPEDYDDFLFSPTDWGIRKLMPRTATKLQGFSHLTDLAMAVNGTGYINVDFLNDPEVIASITALQNAARISEKSMLNSLESTQKLAALGFPQPALFGGAMASAPFDAMSDTLRGMRGVMLDMHRRPEKLLAAIEKMRILITREAIASHQKFNFATAASMLHRGSDGFMSIKQFETFYWPSLKHMWLELIDNGMMTFAFYEGVWDQRLDYLAELPRAKTIGWFQSSDIYKVKEKLGERMCIMGGMPNSMLQGGSVDEVKAYTRKLCQEIGKDGGYIMCTTIGEMEGSKPELVKAWVDATKEFGVLR